MSWETLRPVLLELSEREPPPVVAYPDPRVVGHRRLPVHIVLAPWAQSVAARLHEEFADEVRLVVGNFGYPELVWMDRMGRRHDPPAALTPAGELVDPSVVLVDLRREITVRSGYDGTGEVVIANRTPGVLELYRPTATVVDPDSGITVGALRWLVRHLPGRTPLRLSSGHSGAVHFGFTTASCDPDLGYAVPRGDWAIRVLLPLPDGRTLRAPLLPITVT